MVEDYGQWVPKTELGKEVFEGKIGLADIFKNGRKIKEAKMVEYLIHDLKTEIVFIGDSPGKGGGSRKTPTKRTARMHSSGRRYKTSSLMLVGNSNGYIGMGRSDSKDNRTAIAKATEKAKLSIIPVERGCGSWECACNDKHSIPFTVEGKAGSVRVVLIPAPKGLGLCIGDEAKKMMRLAGIKDIWSKTFGDSRSRGNYMEAVFNAFKKMNAMKIEHEDITDIPLKYSKKVSEIEEPKIEEAKEEVAEKAEVAEIENEAAIDEAEAEEEKESEEE